MILLLLIIPNVLASCEDNQVDINTASLNELDVLTGIGPVKAQAIIDTRPFESVDDLIYVYGIGEITLQKIKEQDLACVDGEEIEKDVEEEIKEGEEIKIINKQEIYVEPSKDDPPGDDTAVPSGEPPENPAPQVIKLNPQVIKSEDTLKGTRNKENSDNAKISGNNYAMYGFVVFCLLLGFLFVIKKNRFNKNEFR